MKMQSVHALSAVLSVAYHWLIADEFGVLCANLCKRLSKPIRFV
jgi:hypothetical protein